MGNRSRLSDIQTNKKRNERIKKKSKWMDWKWEDSKSFAQKKKMVIGEKLTRKSKNLNEWKKKL